MPPQGSEMRRNSSEKRRSTSSRPSTVSFLITEVDAETPAPRDTREDSEHQLAEVLPSPSATATSTAIVDKVQEKADFSASVGSSLPLISVYRVEDAELPPQVTDERAQFAPLPATIPMDKVMTNIVQNLDFKAWSDQSKSMWFKDFKSPPSRAVISDTFWYCICWYFKSGKHPDIESVLLGRISANFVGLFTSVNPSRKDFFFKVYADAVAQAVLYAMFLAYPKSRVHFTESFRKDLVIRISYWTTGVCPEFVDASHWKLNLGGGDVLQSTATSAVQSHRQFAPLFPGCSAASQPSLGPLGADLAAKRTSIARAPRPLRTLRYSPLVENFLRSRKYSSVNLVRPTRIGVTTAEERARLMDAKHALLVERATAASEHCDAVVGDYNELCADLRRQERQRQVQAQTAKKRLEIRRKEVFRSDPHEYANYLVSLHLLQQGLC
eukprot:CAMPEP_0170614284 /NCGR_PEP_ID=MMETSP0224-20130122/24717_1 /TAXON_ID=285029 /ORGANISM="Togula jolla, Strain CCCM 725" /LENGTH=439 /DNA_ID=CAMNT_0010939929 /DNA_START=51 /DNA_END=1370 /DNA_ORIENTATION=-